MTRGISNLCPNLGVKVAILKCKVMAVIVFTLIVLVEASAQTSSYILYFLVPKVESRENFN